MNTNAGRILDLVEVRYRQPAKRLVLAAAGATADQVAAHIADDLDARPTDLAALSDDPPQTERCWVALGPDGARLARVGGMDADTLNAAFAALDAARFERKAA